MTELSKLSHSRLIVRTKYYQDKTLNLEKKLHIADEKIQDLQGKLNLLDKENHQLKEKNAELLAFIDRDQLTKLQRENELLLKKLEQVNAENHERGLVVNNRIEKYEQLLSDIQKEITEKEKELEYYKLKAKSLEKNNKIYTGSMITPHKNAHVTNEQANFIISYFDYSIVKKAEKEFIFIGDYHIQNFGNELCENPTICFRFSPPEHATLKGKIMTIDQATLNKQMNEHTRNQWMFIQTDWSLAAKERGEIWIASTEPIRLHQGDSVTVQGFQIPVALNMQETVIIEGFVYFGSEKKIKSSNNILFTYS